MNSHCQRFRSLLGSVLLAATAAFAVFAPRSPGLAREGGTGGFVFHEHLIAKGFESTADAWGVTPRSPDARLPVIVFLHGSGGSLRGDGKVLRRVAEAGFAGVGMEYSQRNSAAFHRQFAELLTWIRGQPWADERRIVWLGFSLGAQRMLQHLVRDPESRPAIFIRVAGGMVPELRDAASGNVAASVSEQTSDAAQSETGGIEDAAARSRSLLQLPVWLVHGENDRLFKLDDVREVKSRLEGMGATVRLDVLPGRPHAFKEDRAMVIKLLIDRVARHFESVTADDADFAEGRE